MTESSQSDKLSHYNANHKQHLFRCRLCQGKFVSGTRFGVCAHLRRSHHKDESDGDLARRHMILPLDIRRVFCRLCEGSSGVGGEWCCQRLRDLDDSLVEHKDRLVF